MIVHRHSRTFFAVLLAAGFALGACGERGEANEADEGPESAEVAVTPTDSAAHADSLAVYMAEAKISEAEARATALREVPNGVVDKFELEREGGKLLYSYDIIVAGSEGVEEVQIDAITGAVLSRVHETPADEKKEAEKDASGEGGEAP